MSRFLKRFISIILGVFMLSGCFSCAKNKDGNKNQKGDTYYNYIEVYDDKGRVCRIGDPYILKYNGVYYLYTSCTGHMLKIGIPCWSSTNLVDWTFSSWIWGDGNTDYGVEGLSYNAYAPEIVFYKGWFYLCEAPNGAGHYIFKSKTPNGKFELCSDNLGLGIDGHFYIDENGELYLFYAWDSAINYCKLNVENGWVTKENLTKKVVGPYLSSWIEGPEVFDRAGYTYLLYTGNHVNSAHYRMAYAYLDSGSVFTDLQTPDDRILLLNTGDDTPYNKKGYNSNDSYVNVSTYRGLGHGCASYGPNLDSIYLGYHSQGRYDHTGGNATSFDRRFNLTQMYTNQSYLTTNGICITDTPKPTMPDYTTSQLVSVSGKKLTDKTTNAVYTAEINFKLQNDCANIVVGYVDENNFTEIVINGQNLQVERTVLGVKSIVASFNNLLTCENQNDNYHAIKVVNGYSASCIYLDGRLIGNINSSLSSGGKIGVNGSVNGVVTFTNDAYGTSDFESVKNLTATFPAYTYLKGENRGYSIQDATIKANGIRQGEKESTISLDNAIAVKLNQGDWVKYAVNAEKSGEYAFNVEVSANSKNCVFEVIVDDKDVYTMEVKNANYLQEPYVLINAGNFKINSKGIHTLKVRVTSGTLEMRNISTQKDAEKITIEDSLATSFSSGKQIFGSATFDNGLITDASQEKTVYYVGNKGVANFNFSMDISLISGSAGMLIRAKNFSYSGKLATIQDALQGYMLEITNSTISLYKFNSADSRDSKNIYITNLSGTNTFRVMARQNILRVYLNDTEIFRVVDTCSYLDGYCGIYSESSSAKYTNLVYQPL